MTLAERGSHGLTRTRSADDQRPTDRDPLTRAHFREVDRSRPPATPGPVAYAAVSGLPPAVVRELDEVGSAGGRHALIGASTQTTTVDLFTKALRDVSPDEPSLFAERMEEFAYLANVLVAGHDRNGSRLRPKEAADAVIATVCYGAMIEVRALRSKTKRKAQPTSPEFAEVLRQRGADILFRVASSALAAGAAPGVKTAQKSGLLYPSEELEVATR